MGSLRSVVSSLTSMESTSLLIPLLLSIIVTSYSLTSAVPLVDRITCKDSSPNCEKWAIEGMCRQDPDMEAFMRRRCPLACDLCGTRGKRQDKRTASQCEDVAPKCEEMALEGFCREPAHQAFMEKACPYACDICTDQKRRKARAIADMKRSIVEKEEEEKVEEEARGCLDLSNKCEQYAVDGLCRDSETSSLMAKLCPNTCDVCKRELKDEREVEDEEEKEEVEEKKEEEEEEEKVDVEEEVAREVSRTEVRAAMKEERVREARFFASLISDAANADTATAALAAEDGVERRSCIDFSSKCESYATNGLCRNRETSSLMAKSCPSSCGQCVKRGIESENVPLKEKRAICKDNKAKCETWAIHGMCKSDPDMAHFMAKTCPFACELC